MDEKDVEFFHDVDLGDYRPMTELTNGRGDDEEDEDE